MAGFLKGEIGIEKLIQVSDFSKITHKITLHLLIYKKLALYTRRLKQKYNSDTDHLEDYR